MFLSGLLTETVAAAAGVSARRPWTVLLIAALLAAGCALGAARWLTLNADAYALLPEDVPFLQNYNAYKERFTYDRRTNVAVIDAPSPELAETAQRQLRGRLAALDGGERFNAVRAPGTDSFFERNGLYYLSDKELEAAVDRLAQIEPALSILARDPSLAGFADLLDAARSVRDTDPTLADAARRIVAEIGKAARETASGGPNTVSWAALALGPDTLPTRRLVLVQGRLDGKESEVGGDSSTEIRHAAEALGLTEENGYRVRLTGRGPLSAEEMDAAASDMMTASLLSLILVAAVLTVGLRSWKTILACLGTLAVGLAWTFGAATAAVGSLTLVSIVFSVLFIGLGIDFAIHVALRYREEASGDAATSARAAAAGCARPLALCALTSAVGFLAFVPTRYEGLAQVGLIAAMGMGLAFLASFTVLPALLSLLNADRSGYRPATLPGGQRFGGMLRRRRGPIAWCALALGAAAASLSLDMQMDFSSLSLKDPESESLQVLIDLQADGLYNPYALSVPLDDGAEAAVAVAKLGTLDSVAAVRTLSDHVPDGQDLKYAMIREAAIFLWPALNPLEVAEPDPPAEALVRLVDLSGAFDLEAQAALAALAPRDAPDLEGRLTAPLAVTLTRLREALNADPSITEDDLPESVRARYIAPDGGIRIQVLPKGDLRNHRALGAFIADVSAVYPQATGRAALEAGTGAIVSEAFLQAVVTAVAAIFVLLLAVLRSLREALLVLVPLAGAGALAAAFGVLAGVPFNLTNVIVIPLIFGLGVDNGIHVVGRWRETGDIVATMGSSTLRAVMLSGATTLASFATLTIAANAGIAGMGSLLALSMVLMLVATVIVLPALLAFSDRCRT